MIPSLENFLGTIEERLERRVWNKKIMKTSKRNTIPPILVKMYLRIQDDLLKKINNPQAKPQQKETYEILYPWVILHRLYDLNREFINIIPFDYYYSASALTRQVIELYILVLYCRFKPEYKRISLESKSERFSNKKAKIDELKKESVNIPYIKNISKTEFLDAVYSDFQIYSSMFHPTPISFSKNILVFSEMDNHTRFYIENPKITEKDKLLFLGKGYTASSDKMKNIIHQFYAYSGFLLSELRLDDKKETVN